MKLRRVVVTFAMLVSASVGLAQGDAPPTREDVLNLFSLMHVREQVATVMEAIARQQRAIVHDNLKRQTPHITTRDLARLDKFTADIMNELPIEGMLEDMVPVYQKHLNKSDVDAMSAFYSSAPGQKLVREMPAMTTESMQAASPRIQAFMDKVMERAQAMANEKDGQEKKTPQSK